MIVNVELATSVGCEQKDLWETPPKVFDQLNQEFLFTLDPCCEIHTAKCASYFTPFEDGLMQNWGGQRAFVNPPYSRGNIDRWVKKCFMEAQKTNTLVVALLPVSTSAAWFHDWVWKKAELRFMRRRIRFVGAPFTAPFSSVVAIWGGQ